VFLLRISSELHCILKEGQRSDFGRTSEMLTEFVVVFALVKGIGIMENPGMRRSHISKAGHFGDFYLNLSPDFSCPQRSVYFSRLVAAGPSGQSYSSLEDKANES